MASIIKVDQIQSDSGFVDIKTINYAANTTSNTSWSPLFNRLDLPNGCFVGGYNNPSTSLFWAGTNIVWDGSNYKNVMTANSTLYSTSAGAHSFYSMDSAPAGSTISLTGIFSVNKDKTLALQGTSSQIGTGITFPGTQNASADPNTLDDYEEGTWTPVPKFGGGNTGMVYASYGYYVKIGRQVTAWCQWSISTNGSSTGTWTMEGLPFVSSGIQAVGPMLGDGFSYTGSHLNAIIEATNISYVNIAAESGGAGASNWVYLNQSNTVSAGGKYFTITYLTST